MLHTAHVCISMLVHAGTELFSRSTDLVQKIARLKQTHTHTHTPARARARAGGSIAMTMVGMAK